MRTFGDQNAILRCDSPGCCLRRKVAWCKQTREITLPVCLNICVNFGEICQCDVWLRKLWFTCTISPTAFLPKTLNGFQIKSLPRGPLTRSEFNGGVRWANGNEKPYVGPVQGHFLGGKQQKRYGTWESKHCFDSQALVESSYSQTQKRAISNLIGYKDKSVACRKDLASKSTEGTKPKSETPVASRTERLPNLP